MYGPLRCEYVRIIVQIENTMKLLLISLTIARCRITNYQRGPRSVYNQQDETHTNYNHLVLTIVSRWCVDYLALDICRVKGSMVIILDKRIDLLPSMAITCITTALRYAKYDFASEAACACSDVLLR